MFNFRVIGRVVPVCNIFEITTYVVLSLKLDKMCFKKRKIGNLKEGIVGVVNEAENLSGMREL